MNKFILFLILSLILACTRDHMNNEIPDAQSSAVRQLEVNYALAKIYNDSVIFGHNRNQSIQSGKNYDSLFHHYNAAFNICHDLYEHNNNSSDHYHNNQGIVQLHANCSTMGNSMMNAMSCPYCAFGGHTAIIHTKINQLRNQHLQYHP